MIGREFNISLRRDSRGGGMLSELQGTAAAFAPRERIVLLVHGYNVSRDRADAVYAAFKRSLEDAAPTLDGNQICFVHWPGDGPPGFSTASYPIRVQTAKDCAAELARYIEERVDLQGKPSQIIVVAHSLGCRLAIEALLTLKRRPNQTIRLIAMAAAYPVSLASENAFALTAMHPTVLYSNDDWVLRQFFPYGEFLATGKGDSGLPEAVGLRGLPASGAFISRKEMAGYRHGTYWQTAEVAELVCSELGLATRLSIASREMPVQLQFFRELPIRELSER